MPFLGKSFFCARPLLKARQLDSSDGLFKGQAGPERISLITRGLQCQQKVWVKNEPFTQVVQRE